MKYLVDTDVIVNHLREREGIPEQILDEGTISIISLAELIYGAYKSLHPQKTLITLKNDLQILDFEIINLNEIIMAEFGKIKADLEIKGERLDDFDLLIAATAIVNNLTLVTRNSKHFKRIKDLKMI